MIPPRRPGRPTGNLEGRVVLSMGDPQCRSRATCWTPRIANIRACSAAFAPRVGRLRRRLLLASTESQPFELDLKIAAVQADLRRRLGDVAGVGLQGGRQVRSLEDVARIAIREACVDPGDRRRVGPGAAEREVGGVDGVAVSEERGALN